MDTVFTIFLIAHIVGGAVGLITGVLNMARRKGDLLHKRIGKVFVISMLVAGVSSLLLSVMHPNYFLFMVGVFTIYLVGTGQRYLSLRLLGSGQQATWIDWGLTLSMLFAGVVFVYLGIKSIVGGNTFGIVYCVFGGFGLIFTRSDWRHYRGKVRSRNYWMLMHLQRMTGGFIAALTAFLVVNAYHFPVGIPGYIYWLLPTAVITPLIVIWSGRYEVKQRT